MLERKPAEWDYRTLPNKLLELCKNVGDMEQIGTGYYTDSESEMLIILAYLNYGERTNITESMIEQINQAVKKVKYSQLGADDLGWGMTEESDNNQGTGLGLGLNI
ncbi:MAG: hypothetical protein Q4D51_03910 [Eubacteriales bacterium]|nr:hypothetical protein [Eubacteriales bacterium]